MKRRSKSARKITARIERAKERATAWKWLSEARGYWRDYARTGDEAWRDLARDYGHEALEHAAMVKDYGKYAGKVQRTIEAAEKRAMSRRK